MKFMKLGSKPDQFQTDGDTIRYVATELATDMVVSVGDVKFYVHKFPLLSKSSMLQKLVSGGSSDTNDEIDIHDIPGGATAFEVCAKFCYGMVVTLNAYNVVAARCAAEYLEMYEAIEKGNLIYKIDVFLTSSIFRSWKDSIIVLQTTKSLIPWSEELKIVSHCLDSIATRASTDPSKVDWSYTYNRKKLQSEQELQWNGVKKLQAVPRDWWVEDLCELHIDLYKRVITTIKAKGRMSADVIGESLKAYAIKKLPVFTTSTLHGSDLMKYRYLVDTITGLLPTEKSSVPCGFLLKLLQASMMLECDEMGRGMLIQKISQQLDEVAVADLMIRSSSDETAVYEIDVVHELVEKFMMQENSSHTDCPDDREFCQVYPGFISDTSKTKVARLVDGYLAEAAKDPSLPLSKFIGLAEMVASFPRSSHDGIYRAIDMYLKEHPGLTKCEKKKMCRFVDCKKLSGDACAHAVQNERLPMRMVVQVLYFEQLRAASGNNTPDVASSIRAMLPRGSCGSSKSASTNSGEDWEGDQTSEELKDLKGELASLRLRNKGGSDGDAKSNAEKVSSKKVKKMFLKLWSNKDRQGENSSSDTSESPASTSVEETKEVVRVSRQVRVIPNQTQKRFLLTK